MVRFTMAGIRKTKKANYLFYKLLFYKLLFYKLFAQITSPAGVTTRASAAA